MAINAIMYAVDGSEEYMKIAMRLSAGAKEEKGKKKGPGPHLDQNQRPLDLHKVLANHGRKNSRRLGPQGL